MSDPVDSLEYLSSTFDPQSLRVAELRRIFFEHNVDFKSAAKKAELVQIFNEEVKPRAQQWLQARLNPAPSANKIEAVGNASPVPERILSPTKTPGKRGRPRKHPLPEDDDTPPGLSVPPPSTVKRGPGRPRKVAKTESEDEITSEAIASARKSTMEQILDQDMTDVQQTPAPKTVPRPRKSTIKKRETEEAVFSSDNPFQSGSPPPVVSPTKRRQTAIPNSAQKLAPPLAKEARRQTDSALIPQSLSSKAGSSDVEVTFTKAGAHQLKTPRSAFKKSERFMPPISQIKASPAFQSAAQRRKENSLASSQLLGSPSSGDEAAGEEFTREESAKLQPTRKRLIRKQKHPSTLNQLIKWASILGLTAGTAYGSNWYRQERINAGYCGIDSEPRITHPGATATEDLINQVKPQCVPCPPHAVCFPGFRMICEDEFQKVNSPLSLGGLIPISPVCAPDTEKLRKIQLVADEIVETLRDRTASVECGYALPSTDIIMSETELKEKLVAKKSSALTTEQFDTLFDHAIEDVKTREEIEVTSSKPFAHPHGHRGAKRYYSASPAGDDRGANDRPEDIHVENYYHSTSLANISVACSIRHTFFTVLARYRVELIGVLAFALLSMLLKSFFQSRTTMKYKVQALVTRVYDELALARSKAIDNPARYEPHLGVSQLRDSILADEFNYSSRERLWQEVQSIVERNSNVRATQAEIQGEWLRAWEWVGAVREITREEKRRELGLGEGDEFVRPVV